MAGENERGRDQGINTLGRHVTRRARNAKGGHTADSEWLAQGQSVFPEAGPILALVDITIAANHHLPEHRHPASGGQLRQIP